MDQWVEAMESRRARAQDDQQHPRQLVVCLNGAVEDGLIANNPALRVAASRRHTSSASTCASTRSLSTWTRARRSTARWPSCSSAAACVSRRRSALEWATWSSRPGRRDRRLPLAQEEGGGRLDEVRPLSLGGDRTRTLERAARPPRPSRRDDLPARRHDAHVFVMPVRVGQAGSRPLGRRRGGRADGPHDRLARLAQGSVAGRRAARHAAARAAPHRRGLGGRAGTR